MMAMQTATWRYRLTTPGALAFATCYFFESLARATLVTVLPLQALALLGQARNVSILYALAGSITVVLGLFMPMLTRRFRPGRVYAAGGASMALAPLCLALATPTGLAAAVIFTTVGQSLLVNGMNLMMMMNVGKRDLVYADSLKLFGGATPWLFGPALGVYLFEHDASLWAIGLSAAAGLAVVVYAGMLDVAHPESPLAQVPPATFRPIHSFRRFLAQPRLRLAWVLNFAKTSFWATFFVYGPLYIVTVGIDTTTGSIAISIAAGLLYIIPAFAWLARRIGVRPVIIGGFAVIGVSMALVTLAANHAAIAIALILIGAIAGVALDATTSVTFLRAVRARERPEMGMVYSYTRDAAGLLPHTLFAILLSFFGLDAVFIVTALGTLACAWLGRWVPRSM